MKASLILLCVTVVVCLILGELVAALFFPQATMGRVRADSPRIFRESELLPYELLPGAESIHRTTEFEVSIRINSLGYRGPEFERRKGDRPRVLVVGDSFTFGHGCSDEQSYVRVLERSLGTAAATGGVEVINAGYAACNYPDTYYLYLSQKGLDLEPDVIVIGFFIGNDIDRQGLSFHEWAEVDSAGLPLRIVGTAAHVEDGYWVSNHRATRYRYPVLRNSHLAQAIISATREMRKGEQAPIYNEVMYARDPSDRTDAATERVQRMFRSMKDKADESGARLVVVIIPTCEQVCPELVFGDSGLDADLNLPKPQRVFGQFFEEHGIDFVDLLPPMRRLAFRKELYYPVDHHWTVRGNEVAGELIADWFIERGILDAVGRSENNGDATGGARRTWHEPVGDLP